MRPTSHAKAPTTTALAVFLIGGCASTQRMPTQQQTEVRWAFEGDRVDHVPGGWRIAETNPTEKLATWKVTRDATAPSGSNVFALTQSKNYDGTYNLAIAEGTAHKDLDLTVKVKAVAGKEDQGGGPIWRCQDAKNYYICRINPLESNYRVYKVVDGRRRQLDSAKVELQANRWYALRVTMIGDHITCYLEGAKMLEATDTLIRSGGKVGLWTKADAVTWFDDLSVREATRATSDSGG